MLLRINNLTASIDNKKIIDNLSINIKKGEVHALMGQNGSGKSTFSNILAGKEEYEIHSDEMTFDGENLSDLSIEERSRKGLFLAFQYPVEIPGVNITPFLQSSINSKLKNKKQVLKVFPENGFCANWISFSTIVLTAAISHIVAQSM